MATHNGLMNAFSKHSHLDELADPLEVAGNLLTPAMRRALAQANLGLAWPVAVSAGAGFTGGVGAVYKAGVARIGDVIKTQILLDLTGVGSSTTDGDIIGVGASAAHIGQITAARNGTPFAGLLTCLEVPATGVVDIDLFYATVATGVFDGAISGLTGQTSLISSGGNWTSARALAIADPAALADKYLYLVNGAAGTVGTYTAGKFLLELWGYA